MNAQGRKDQASSNRALKQGPKKKSPCDWPGLLIRIDAAMLHCRDIDWGLLAVTNAAVLSAGLQTNLQTNHAAAAARPLGFIEKPLSPESLACTIAEALNPDVS